MNELEKMQQVIAFASTMDEKRQLSDAQEALANIFKALLFGAGEAIKKDGKLITPSLSEAKNALLLFQQAGAKCGIEFPQTESPQELKQYLIQWGMEIMTIKK